VFSKGCGHPVAFCFVVGFHHSAAGRNQKALTAENAESAEEGKEAANDANPANLREFFLVNLVNKFFAA
jgi:hypothetical protein